MRRKGNLFRRMAAVLLSAALIAGLVSQAATTEVFAAGADVTGAQEAGAGDDVPGAETGVTGAQEAGAGSDVSEAEAGVQESTQADGEQAAEEKSDAADAGQTEETEEGNITESDSGQTAEEAEAGSEIETEQEAEESAVQEGAQDAADGDEPTSVFAQDAEESESYGLWVNGIRVTDANAADVLGNSTVSYAPDTNVLTLDGANLTTAYEPDDLFIPAAIYADGTFGSLKLNIQGTNTITTGGSGYDVSGIFAMDSAEFSGDGSLTVAAENQYMYGTGYAVYSYGGNVTITGGTYSFTGTGGSNGYGYGMYVSNNMGTVYVNGGKLTAKGAGGNGKVAIGGKLDVSGYTNCEVIASMDASGKPETDYNSDDITYYANIKVMPWTEPEYDENGFSADGRFYQPAVQADDGYYELTNAGNLYWFAELLKSDTASGYENVRLTKDITIPAGMNWKPISVGQWNMPYQGTFDGNGKSISNLSVFRDETDIYDTSASAGLFNTIGGDGVVKSLTMRNTGIKVTASAGAICGTNYGTIDNCCNLGGEISVSTTYAGGIAGLSEGKIVRCLNTGTVYARDEIYGDCAGGICGYASEGAVIENCYNTGTIGNANVARAGGVTGGYRAGTKITGCYNIGAVTAGDGAEGIGCYVDGSQPSAEDVKNNYYLAEEESEDGGRTAEQFASGEVAWLLNEGNTDGTQAYYQTCGEGTPAFTGRTVYRVMSYRCPGDSNGEVVYSNAAGNVTGEHSYGAWTVKKEATENETGLKERSCEMCGDTQTEVIPKISGSGTQQDSDWIEVEKGEGEDVPDVALAASKNDMISAVLTPEEQSLAEAGTDIKLVLAIANADASVSEPDKQAAAEMAGDFTVGPYVDIHLFKVIGGSRTEVSQTNRKIRVVLTVPDSLKNTDSGMIRSYAVVRVHNGAAELLSDIDNDEATITIETDQFFTYALVYKDTPKGDNGGENNAGGNDGSHDPNPVQAKDNEPKTGDNPPLELSATLAMIVGFSYLILYFSNRRRGMTEESKKEIVSRLAGWAGRGGRHRKLLALAAIFVLLVYYHSIGKRTAVEWEGICEK